jgi:hypothetical protein
LVAEKGNYKQIIKALTEVVDTYQPRRDNVQKIDFTDKETVRKEIEKQKQEIASTTNQ